MKLELPLEQMTVAEKLEAMETLWVHLSQRAPDEVVPDWHAEVLAERERRLTRGQETIHDWEDAKRLLRRQIHERKDS
jgi:hypothetical protein